MLQAQAQVWRLWYFPVNFAKLLMTFNDTFFTEQLLETAVLKKLCSSEKLHKTHRKMLEKH